MNAASGQERLLKRRSTYKLKPMKLISILFLVVPIATMHVDAAHALCLDPKSGISGYKVPLRSETQASNAIIVGRVLSENALKEDRSDPSGVTAYNVNIEVLSTLKGRLPKVFSVRNENTSARYEMSIGEEHVLFISQESDGKLWINSCGSSSKTSKDNKLVKQIQAELQK